MLVGPLDDFDPNVLFNQPPHECRVYGDDMAQTWAVVSSEDYQECIKHRWRYKASNERPNGKTKKYLARNRHVRWDNGGAARHNRTQENYFLHEFIMDRMGQPRPSPKHIVDHRDGDENNCRRENLRWATLKFNANNRHGRLAGKEHDENACATV
jgi:hypothetical protein